MTVDDFDNWRLSVTVFDIEEGGRARDAFIDSFVDRAHPRFGERIATPQKFNDGDYYTGYLWDYMYSRTFVDVDTARRRLAGTDPVIAFWDLHSSERIRTPNYWRFERNAVLRLRAAHLVEGLAFLPEDLYVFDSTLAWAIAFTHEYSDDEVRQCVTQGL